MRDAVGIGLETRVVSQILAAHRGQQIMPVLFDCDVHCDIAVIGRIDIERRARTAAIAGTRWNVARVPIGFEMRREGGVGGLLHRDFDEPAPAGALAFEQRRRHRGVKVDA